MEVSLLAQGFRIDGINNCVCVGGVIHKETAEFDSIIEILKEADAFLAK